MLGGITSKVIKQDDSSQRNNNNKGVYGGRVLPRLSTPFNSFPLVVCHVDMMIRTAADSLSPQGNLGISTIHWKVHNRDRDLPEGSGFLPTSPGLLRIS